VAAALGFSGTPQPTGHSHEPNARGDHLLAVSANQLGVGDTNPASEPLPRHSSRPPTGGIANQLEIGEPSPTGTYSATG
jgi:hypothetical protein